MEMFFEGALFFFSSSNTGAKNVRNDCAERVAKLGTDFTPYAQSEDHFIKIIF